MLKWGHLCRWEWSENSLLSYQEDSLFFPLQERPPERSALSQLSHKTHFPKDFPLSRTCAVCLGFIFTALWGRGSSHSAKTCLQQGGTDLRGGRFSLELSVNAVYPLVRVKVVPWTYIVLQKDSKYYWCQFQSKLRTQAFFVVIFTWIHSSKFLWVRQILNWLVQIT